MNHPLALCELAARALNTIVGHRVKQNWMLNERYPLGPSNPCSLAICLANISGSSVGA
jgi:hypothetical protein